MERLRMRSIRLLRSSTQLDSFLQLDRFAEELRSLNHEVAVLLDEPTSDDGRSYLLSFNGSPSAWMTSPGVPQRTVLLRCMRPPMMFTELEMYRLAAAVDETSFSNWASSRAGYWIGGRRDVLARMHVTVGPESFSSPKYQEFHLTEEGTLVTGLVRYLEALNDLIS